MHIRGEILPFGSAIMDIVTSALVLLHKMRCTFLITVKTRLGPLQKNHFFLFSHLLAFFSAVVFNL